MKIKYKLTIEDSTSLHPIFEKDIMLDTREEFGVDFDDLSQYDKDLVIESWLKDVKEEFLFNKIDVRHRKMPI